MKKAGILCLLLLLLTGCSGHDKEIDRAMQLRTDLLQSDGCSFEADITADYGDKLHFFSMACHSDEQGDISFSVLSPETIAGITGRISQDGGKLTFDDTALHFSLLADDQLSPVSAPWIFLKSLRSGYFRAAGLEGEELRVTVDDSYEEDALMLDIWLSDRNVPNRCEILYRGKRILSLTVRKFGFV